MFSVAAVWFLGFGWCIVVIIFCYLCRKREPYSYSPTCYALSLILLILLTFAAIYTSLSSSVFLVSGLVGSVLQFTCLCVNRIGCAALYIGQGSFHHSTTTTLQYVVHQADSTVDKLRNVSDYLAQAKQARIKRGTKPVIKFKGYLIENGVMDEIFDGNALVPFVHGMGLISDDIYKDAEASCKVKYYNKCGNDANDECCKNLKRVDRAINRLNVYYTLDS